MTTTDELAKEQCKITIDAVAAWGAFALKLYDEIIDLKQLCRQAKGCLVGGCQGIPDRVSLLCDELGKASAGVEFLALPEPTPEWIAEYGRRILEHYPTAYFDAKKGRWVVPDTRIILR